MMLFHYIDNIMLIGSGESEVQNITDTLVEHMHSQGWEIAYED